VHTVRHVRRRAAARAAPAAAGVEVVRGGESTHYAVPN